MKENSEEKFTLIYKKEIEKIDHKLSRVFINKKPSSLYEPCRYIIDGGGKRLRPFLVLLSSSAAGGKFNQVYNAAIAVEILHNFTLAHDDIMDNADLRRGRPTMHKKYDINTAILAGDNMNAVAYHYLLKDCMNNDKQVLQKFTDGIIEICEGQSYDKEFELRSDVTIDEYLKMIKKKTAALAEICCSIGARIGGGTEPIIKALEGYGRNLGMAFQLQDDLLDIFGDEAEFGKKVGGDLIEGKKTYLFLKALESSDGKDRAALEDVIRNKGVKNNQVGFYKDLYFRLGVIDETQSQIKKYTSMALKSLKPVKNNIARQMMIWLANSLIKRSK